MWVISLLECSDRLVLPGCVIFLLPPFPSFKGRHSVVSYKVTCLSDSAERTKAETCNDAQDYKLKQIKSVFLFFGYV